CQHSRARSLWSKLMAPTNLAGLVVDGLDHTLAPNAVIRSSPSVDAIGWLREVDTVARMGVDDKQTVPAIEAGRTVVSHSALVGRNQASIGRRFLGGIRNRTALLIDSQRPVHWPERNSQQILPVGAVKNKEVAVARGLHQHLLRLSAKISVDQHWSLDRIPIVRIVWRDLEGPHQLARIRAQGDDGAGVKIIARTRRAFKNGSRIPGSPIDEIEIRIISPRHPRHSPSRLVRSSRRRSGIPLPLGCAG